MWHTWDIVPTGWKSVIALALVAVVLSVSACSAPGHVSSPPSGAPTEEGRRGSRALHGSGY
jgi:hypothetical protein